MLHQVSTTASALQWRGVFLSLPSQEQRVGDVAQRSEHHQPLMMNINAMAKHL